MTFKALLQALEKVYRLIIDVTTNFRPFYAPKNVTKFVCPQTLKVTYTCAWKNYIGERRAILLLINKLT